MPFLPHLALLVCNQLCEVLLPLSKKLHMKRAGVVEKFNGSLTREAFLSYHNELFCVCVFTPPLPWDGGTA